MSKRKAIVTGGVRGIGLEVARLLLAADCEVVVTTRSASKKPADLGGQVFECDLTDLSATDRLVEAHGDAEILINNAGHMYGLPPDQYDEAKRAYMLNLNMIAPIELMAKFGILMGGRGQGRIVNNASIAAHIGHPDFWYGATKAALLNATKSMARSFGAQGIVCNAVAAGPTNTDMLESIPEARKATMKANSILGRFAEAGEVAKAIVWLALECPPYINGTCIDINNGTFMR